MQRQLQTETTQAQANGKFPLVLLLPFSSWRRANARKGGMQRAKTWHTGAQKSRRQYHPNAPAKIPAEEDKEGTFWDYLA